MELSDYVLKLQLAMNAMGADLLEDGDFGPKTEAEANKYDFSVVAKPKPKSAPAPTPAPAPVLGNFSTRSKTNLGQCHPNLQTLAAAINKRIAIEVICGYRGEKEQNEAYAKGTSKLKFPNSKHNKSPALAFDACPLPINWSNRVKFDEMRKVAQDEANKLGIKIRLISWDLPHIELA